MFNELHSGFTHKRIHEVLLLPDFNKNWNVKTNFRSILRITRNGVHKEITNTVNSAQNILFFRLRSVNIKIKMYKTKMLSVGLYVG
jgi:hypothetical protein